MSRLRKLQKAIVKEGPRRSPRICALEAWQANGSESQNGTKCSTRLHLDNAQGPAFRTRGRKKRKRRPVQEVIASASASVLSPPNQDVSHSHDEGTQNKSDQPSKVPSSTILPEKRILELVLDTLQRRDTYEIFAEPVDPNEVEDYHEIIEEPMDFGTMRAKLHEGMYKSLEQFEHDVFLIFNNAMHFNSPDTIYFRQARGINELAKKVFDLLKTNPEKFELEFSETRRRVTRRNQGDFRDSTDIKTSEITTGLPSKTVPCSSRGTSNRKSFKANHGCSDIIRHVDARDLEVPTGTKENSRCRSFEVDRRCTYTPLSLSEDEPIFSTVYGKLKQLEYVNQQEVGYRDSLMLFVKDLGPTAQNIAKRKLLGCEIRSTSTSAPCRPNTFSPATALMSHYPLNRFPDHSNETGSPREKIDLSGGIKTSFINDKTDNVKGGGTLNADSEKVCSPLESNTQGSHRRSFGCDKVFSNQSFCSDSYYSRACADDMNISDHGSKETGKKSMMMLLGKSKLVNQEQLSVSNLENFQADVLESRLEGSTEKIDLSGGIKTSFINDKTDNVKVGGTLNADREKVFSPLESNTQGSHRWSFGCDKVFSNHSFCSDSYYSRACADDMNISDHGSKETGKKSMMMLLGKSKLVNQEQLSVSNLENFQADVLESRLEGSREKIDLSGGIKTSFINDKTDNVKVGGMLNADREKVFSPLESNTQGSHRWSFGCDKVFSNHSFCSDSYYSRACADDMNISDHGSKETGKKSMMMLLGKSKLVNQEQLSVSNLENFQADVLESRLEGSREKIDLSGGIKTSFINDKTDNVKVGGMLNADREKVFSPLESNTQGSHRWSFGCDKVFSNQSFCSDSYYSRACADDMNISDHGSKETGKKSMMMLLGKSKLVNQEQLSVSNLENFQADVLESRLEGSREKIDLSGGIKTSFINDKTDNVKVGGMLNADREKVFSPLESNTQGSHRWSFGCDKVFSNQSFCSDSYYSRACAYDMNISDHGSKETGKKSMRMLLGKSKLVNQEQLSVSNLENFQADVLESRLENKCKFQSRPWPLESSDVSCFVQDKSQMPKSSSECVMGDRENVEAKCPKNETGCSSEGMKNLKSDQTASPASSFVFNLAYLKTRLDEINSSKQYRVMQQDSSGKTPFSAQVSYQGVLTRNPPTDLRASLYSHYQQQ